MILAVSVVEARERASSWRIAGRVCPATRWRAQASVFYSRPRPDTGRKSTGVGLSIVAEITRLHGGDFRVGNRGEGGARAKLSITIEAGGFIAISP